MRECILRGEIKLDYISTDINPADILTKALPHPKFEHLRTKLGLVNLTEFYPTSRNLQPSSSLVGLNTSLISQQLSMTHKRHSFFLSVKTLIHCATIVSNLPLTLWLVSKNSYPTPPSHCIKLPLSMSNPRTYSTRSLGCIKLILPSC